MHPSAMQRRSRMHGEVECRALPSSRAWLGEGVGGSGAAGCSVTVHASYVRRCSVLGVNGVFCPSQVKSEHAHVCQATCVIARLMHWFKLE